MSDCGEIVIQGSPRGEIVVEGDRVKYVSPETIDTDFDQDKSGVIDKREVVQFTDQSSDPQNSTPYEHFWDFGDGDLSRQASPAHTYLKPGIHTVKKVAAKPNLKGNVKEKVDLVDVAPYLQNAFLALTGPKYARFGEADSLHAGEPIRRIDGESLTGGSHAEQTTQAKQPPAIKVGSTFVADMDAVDDHWTLPGISASEFESLIYQGEIAFTAGFRYYGNTGGDFFGVFGSSGDYVRLRQGGDDRIRLKILDQSASAVNTWTILDEPFVNDQGSIYVFTIRADENGGFDGLLNRSSTGFTNYQTDPYFPWSDLSLDRSPFFGASNDGTVRSPYNNELLLDFAIHGPNEIANGDHIETHRLFCDTVGIP